MALINTENEAIRKLNLEELLTNLQTVRQQRTRSPAVAGMDRPFRDLQMTPKCHSRSKVSFTKWAMVDVSSIDTRGLGATVKTPRSIFTFVTLK